MVQNMVTLRHLVWVCGFGGLFLGELSEGLAESEPKPKTMEKVTALLNHNDLVILYRDWRKFESPPLLEGAPDYTKARRQTAYQGEFQKLKARLDEFDIEKWPTHEQVDWHLIRAEMNGYEFNHHVLKPWVRDPAFYKSVWLHQSDVPAHEGPTHHRVVDLWTYSFPLSAAEESRLIEELSVIKPLLTQAQQNLTGDAAELWIAGIRDIEQQDKALVQLRERLGDAPSPKLLDTIQDAWRATLKFADWLKAQADTKVGPSGIGKENYTWYLQNVHLVPLSWDDEVQLLQRELDRSWSSLKLEEQRNKDKPELVEVKNAKEYDERAEKALARLIKFLSDKKVMSVEKYMASAIQPHLGSFVPKATRNFFYIGAHYDPTPLLTHWYHWWDLARMKVSPHPSEIRQEPMLYNIFDSRAEGTATGVEEMFMHAGLYDDSPRSREIVWIMLSQRAARGLGSLYAHANDMTMTEAGTVHMEWTPRGWMKTEPELLQFEQHLYLRQPGYGTSYITGKYLLEKLVAMYAKQLEDHGEPFELDVFFDTFNSMGVIPMSLIQYELTGSTEGLDQVLSTSKAPWTSSEPEVPTSGLK